VIDGLFAGDLEKSTTPAKTVDLTAHRRRLRGLSPTAARPGDSLKKKLAQAAAMSKVRPPSKALPANRKRTERFKKRLTGRKKKIK